MAGWRISCSILLLLSSCRWQRFQIIGALRPILSAVSSDPSPSPPPGTRKFHFSPFALRLASASFIDTRTNLGYNTAPYTHPPTNFCSVSQPSPALCLYLFSISIPLLTPSPTQFPLSIHLWCIFLFYFPFWLRFMIPPLGLPYYLASLGLWIVTWLSFTLQLVSTYKWVHSILVFLTLAYHTQGYVFLLSSFCFQISWCIVFNS